MPLQIPKEHLEQWFVQALQVESVGAGSYPIDILKPNEWGADIKMLSCTLLKDGTLGNSQSNETSLAQKFKLTGTDLDTYFKTKKYNEIIKGWIDILYKKLNEVKNQKNISDIYYFFLLRGTLEESYICAFKVDCDLINDAIMTLKQNDNATESVFINGLIDNRYGSCKIYKAKKRLELRLKPKKLLDDGFLISIATKVTKQKNIYKLVQNKHRYEKYIKDKVEDFLRYPRF